jgi:DNA-binding NarL/FixJ family response regulator
LAWQIIARATLRAQDHREVAMTNRSSDAATALRVLVVDDSAPLRECIRLTLEREGLVVVGEAADGAQALDQTAATRPDVVLMDLRMPRMNGIQATQVIRRRYPDTQVVLWTGEDDAQLTRAVRQSGAHAGVPKGTCAVELVATLRGVCDGDQQAFALRCSAIRHTTPSVTLNV